MSRIRFGTSGWRGVIADDFTFERSRLVVAAVARHLYDTGEAGKGVLVAHDTRFLAEEFAADAARTLSDLGIGVMLCAGPTPTPAVSAVILKRGLGGAVNFTASHNPSNYQGIKFSPSWGGPAMPAATGAIEENIDLYQRQGLPAPAASRGRVETIDPADDYFGMIRSRVDLDAVARSGIRIAFDALHGAGAAYLDRVLEESGCSVKTIHGHRDPLFGGHSPEPSEERLAELAGVVTREADLGVSTDGDADRFGILGQQGEFYNPNTVLAILADYLIGVRGFEGDLARSVATTVWLDTIAGSFGRKCHETPVGFKYIGQMIAQGKLAMGGEESAGMSIRGHVPEKDGILACLLVAEMVAASGVDLQRICSDLERKYGPRLSVRVNLELTPDLAEWLGKTLKSPPREVGGFRAADLVATDGTKWLFEGGDWVLLRLSGTEPVARLYLEARTPDRLEELRTAFSDWVSRGQSTESRGEGGKRP